MAEEVNHITGVKCSHFLKAVLHGSHGFHKSQPFRHLQRVSEEVSGIHQIRASVLYTFSSSDFGGP